MTRWVWTAVLAGSLGTAIGCADPAVAQTAPRGPNAAVSTTSANASGDFRYEKALASPKTLEIRGINGAVRAFGTSSSTVEVRATKKVTQGDPAGQRVVATEHKDGVLICVLHANQPDRDCNPDQQGARADGSSSGDIRIDFDVRVPAGVVFVAETKNGNIEARDLHSRVRVATLNGDVEASTTGFLSAKTTNGRITAQLPRDVSMPAQLQTVNGAIDLRVPPTANFDLAASTTNGHITSDFSGAGRSATVGTLESMMTKVGSGGQRVALQTVSGDIAVKRVP